MPDDIIEIELGIPLLPGVRLNIRALLRRVPRQAEVDPVAAIAHRYITTTTALVLMIWVRRFLCQVCRVSVSCLPAFAQPYRLVNTPTIATGFTGQEARPEVQRSRQLIESYWRRFETHLPLLVRQVGNAFGPVQPRASGGKCWLGAPAWQAQPSNWCIGFTPVHSALIAATSAGSFRLHKGSPRRSPWPVIPHTPLLSKLWGPGRKLLRV